MTSNTKPADRPTAAASDSTPCASRVPRYSSPKPAKRPTRGLLHGGGPGASGVYRTTPATSTRSPAHRVIVPDLPGYGPRTKHVDLADPFGYLADSIRGLLDNWASTDSAPDRQLLRRRRRAAAGARYPGPRRPDGVHGSRRHRHHPGTADRRLEEPAAQLLRRLRASPPQAGDVHPHYLVYDGALVPDSSSSTSATGRHRPGGGGQPRRYDGPRNPRRCGHCGGWT